MVDQLEISAAAFGHFQLLAGGSTTLHVGTVECCYAFVEADTCVTWSASPTTGLTLDSTTGALSVASDTPSGTTYTIRADVENGRRIVSATLTAYTREGMPLVGLWQEVSQLDCSTRMPVAPQRPIGEVIFRADSTFGVTWTPFEIYQDYWGTFQTDAQGGLTLSVVGGNYVPPDVDGTGTFEVDASGNLVLHDIWLGTPNGETVTPACGHVLN